MIAVLTFSDYRDSDASIKVIGFSIQLSSRKVKSSIEILMEKSNPQLRRNKSSRNKMNDAQKHFLETLDS